MEKPDMREELLKGLTEDQIKKVRECKDTNDLLQLAKDEGVELNDEQLAAVSGGICTSTPSFTCPKCGSNRVKTWHRENSINEWYHNECEDCQFWWNVDA